MPAKLASKQADYDPLCPHCEKKLDEVHWRHLEAVNAEDMFDLTIPRKAGNRKQAYSRNTLSCYMDGSICIL